MKCWADSPRSTAVLQTQSWEQYITELLGSQTAPCDPPLDGDGVDIYYSFQDTSADIEQWAMGQTPHRSTEDGTPAEKVHVCYGMVSRQKTILVNLIHENQSRLVCLLCRTWI